MTSITAKDLELAALTLTAVLKLSDAQTKHISKKHGANISWSLLPTDKNRNVAAAEEKILQPLFTEGKCQRIRNINIG